MEHKSPRYQGRSGVSLGTDAFQNAMSLFKQGAEFRDGADKAASARVHKVRDRVSRAARASDVPRNLSEEISKAARTFALNR